jgi:hypothetical protein
MPIDISCPGCGKLLHAAESFVGMRIRCPACAMKVLVPAPGRPGQPPAPAETATEQISAKPLPPPPYTPSPPDPVEDPWAAGARSSIDPRWRLVGVGLLLVQIGTGLFLLGYAAAVLGPVLLIDLRVPGDVLESRIRMLLMIARVALLLAAVLFLVGQGLCAVVPDASGGRSTARLAFLLLVPACLLGVGLMLLSPQQLSITVLLTVAIIFRVLVFGAHTFFVLFVREVASFAKRQQAADLAKAYLALWVLGMVFDVVQWLKPTSVGGGIAIALAAAPLIVGLIFFILLASVRNGVRQYLRHGDRPPDE